MVQDPYKRIEKVKDWLEEAMAEPAQIADTLAGVPATADPGSNWDITMKYEKFLKEHPECRV